MPATATVAAVVLGAAAHPLPPAEYPPQQHLLAGAVPLHQVAEELHGVATHEQRGRNVPLPENQHYGRRHEAGGYAHHVHVEVCRVQVAFSPVGRRSNDQVGHKRFSAGLCRSLPVPAGGGDTPRGEATGRS